jgi:type III secretion system YscI/HrpB-like protein
MRIGGESPAYELVPIEPSEAAAVPGEGRVGGGVSFSKALKGLGGAVDRGEALIAGAARGNLGGLDSAQLIALQAGIYRYSEAVDLVAKLVDRASTAVKTLVSPH